MSGELTEALWKEALEHFQNAEENRVDPAYALRRDLENLRIYEEPIFAVASAGDPLFEGLKQEAAIGPHFLTPAEWLPPALTVLAYFLPFTEPVRRSNRMHPSYPSTEWQHGRIEGEQMNTAFRRHLAAWLEQQGYECLIPGEDPRYLVQEPVSSNWSERHAAYIAGLGTFGMSKGLITAKGIAGRVGTVITSAPLAVTKRPYRELYEYCSRCGACARRCPAGAIVPGPNLHLCKNNPVCGDYLQPLKDWSAAGGDTRPPEERDGYRPEKMRIRFGCGKCQVGVPCEDRIPGKRCANSGA